MSDNQPLVSVIVPNYNYSRYLPSRLDSVLGQSYGNIEVIVLDDCSTDNSVEIAEEYARRDRRIVQVVRNATNSGSPFVQWQRGLEMARGKYVWIAEADDLAHTDFLRFTVEALEAAPSAAFAMAQSELIDSDGAPSQVSSFDFVSANGSTELYAGADFCRMQLELDRNLCYNASMALIRRDAYERLTDDSWKRMRYCGDWLFWMEMMHQGDVALVRRKLNRFRLHRGSVTTGSTSDGGAQNACNPELWNFKLRLLAQPERYPMSFYRRMTMRYRIYRDLHRGGSPSAELMNKIHAINPDFESDLKVSAFNYPIYWLAKHIVPISRPRMAQKK